MLGQSRLGEVVLDHRFGIKLLIEVGRGKHSAVKCCLKLCPLKLVAHEVHTDPADQ